MLSRDVHCTKDYLVLEGHAVEQLQDWPDEDDLPPGACRFSPKKKLTAFETSFPRVTFVGIATSRQHGVLQRVGAEFGPVVIRMTWDRWVALRRRRREDLALSLKALVEAEEEMYP